MKSSVLNLAIAIFANILLLGCEKSTDAICDKISSAKIQVTKTSYFTGEEIKLSTVEGSNIFYSWHFSKDFGGDLGSSSSVSIANVSKVHEGWYYLTVSNPACTTKHDSVYITVTNKPVVAPCSPVNNKVDFSSLPDITFSSATWAYEVSYNSRNLRGFQSIGYPDINVYFHHYWNNKEPEDGEYSLHNVPAFTNVDTYSVYLASFYGLNLYVGSGKVYVSHVNGKIQVTFCNVPFSGNGSSFTASGRLTAP